jgi:hypothetical protein
MDTERPRELEPLDWSMLMTRAAELNKRIEQRVGPIYGDVQPEHPTSFADIAGHLLSYNAFEMAQSSPDYRNNPERMSAVKDNLDALEAYLNLIDTHEEFAAAETSGIGAYPEIRAEVPRLKMEGLLPQDVNMRRYYIQKASERFAKE